MNLGNREGNIADGSAITIEELVEELGRLGITSIKRDEKTNRYTLHQSRDIHNIPIEKALAHFEACCLEYDPITSKTTIIGMRDCHKHSIMATALDNAIAMGCFDDYDANHRFTSTSRITIFTPKRRSGLGGR